MREGVIVESVVVGFTTLAIGSAFDVCAYRNQVVIPFAGTFLVGFLAHLGYEYLGLNEWFCETRM